MAVAYIDESGSLADKRPFFIVAGVPIEEDKLPSRIIKRVRRVLGRKKGKVAGELKFTSSSERVKKYVAKRLEAENLYCFVFVLDKVGRKIADTPENYGVVLGWVLKEGFGVFGWERVVVDKKFDKERDQRQLTTALKEEKIQLDKVRFADSKTEDGIKLVDFVAGYYASFYNRSKPLPRLLKNIVVEERTNWKVLKRQKAVASKGSDVSK